MSPVIASLPTTDLEIVARRQETVPQPGRLDTGGTVFKDEATLRRDGKFLSAEQEEFGVWIARADRRPSRRMGEKGGVART